MIQKSHNEPIILCFCHFDILLISVKQSPLPVHLLWCNVLNMKISKGVNILMMALPRLALKKNKQILLKAVGDACLSWWTHSMKYIPSLSLFCPFLSGPDREEPFLSVLEAGRTHRVWLILPLYLRHVWEVRSVFLLHYLKHLFHKSFTFQCAI